MSAMEKLKSLVPEKLKVMVAAGEANDLPSVSSSLLEFFLQLPHFHQMIGDLADPKNGLCGKDKDAALASKQIGNQCYLSGDYFKALASYTQALRVAPPNATEMGKNLVSTLYMNRASLLQKMGLLEECLRDCSRALQISPRYAKAWYWRGKANAFLGNFKDAIHDLNIAKTVEVSLGGKKRIESELKEVAHDYQKIKTDIVPHEASTFSDELCKVKIKCVNTSSKGRGMVSESGIPPGFLVHTEEPYAAMISKDYRETRCHYCFNELPGDTVPCASCTIPLYCSERCQKCAGGVAFCDKTKDLGPHKNKSCDLAFIESYVRNITLCSDSSSGVECFHEHKHECRGVHWPVVLPSDVVLASRALVKLTLQGRGYVEELSHNYSQIPGESKLEIQIYSIVLLYCLQHSDEIDISINGASISQVILIISRIRVNSMAIVRMKSQNSSTGEHGKGSSNIDALTSTLEQVRVGQAIYAAASLFNHSCRPNIHAYFLSRALYIRTTEFVPMDNPLEFSYGPQVGQFQCKDRLEILEEKYSFQCQCSGCSEVNFSDLVIDAFRCSNLNCRGVVLDSCVLNCEKHKAKTVLDKTNNDDISEVVHFSLELKDNYIYTDPGYCLKCGSYCDMTSSCATLTKTRKYIKRLQDAIISKKKYHTILADALECLSQLKSRLHAYNKAIAEVEDKLALAFCSVGDFQSAYEHCKASLEIVEVLYGSSHIAIGHELVKLVSIQLSLGDISALDNINRLGAIFLQHYGLHTEVMLPYLESLKIEACKLPQ